MTGNMKDFATGIVVTAPSPEVSGTTLTLQAGEGARMPSTPFSATAYPETEFPTLDNAERIEVTDVTGDVLTIVRAQGDTTAKNIVAGFRISNALFLDNLEETDPVFTAWDKDYDDLTNKPITPAGTGFTITAGTTPKTLTVGNDASVSGTNTGDQTLPTRDSLGLDTDDTPRFAGVNIGHVSDTTISRVSAGKIAVEGKEIIDASSAQTATNKVVTNVATTAPATPADGMLWWDTDDATSGLNVAPGASGNIMQSNGTDWVSQTGGAGTGIANANLNTTAGELGGAWTTWVPTFTNFTKGNATIVARYQQIGKTIRAFLSVTLGSTSAMTGSFTFSLPVTGTNVTALATTFSQSMMTDINTTNVVGQLRRSSTTGTIYIQTSNGTYTQVITPSSSTVPFTWAATHVIETAFEYEAA